MFNLQESFVFEQPLFVDYCEPHSQFYEAETLENSPLNLSFELKDPLETRSVSERDDLRPLSQQEAFFPGNASDFLCLNFSPVLEREDEADHPFSDCLSTSKDPELPLLALKKIKKPLVSRSPAKPRDPRDAVKKELRKQSKKLKEHWSQPWVVAPTPFKKIAPNKEKPDFDAQSFDSLLI